MRGIRRAARFGISWARGRAPVQKVRRTIDGEEAPLLVDVYFPRACSGSAQGVPASAGAEAASSRLPGWIVLHGITRPGPAHPSLVRFAGALASTGAVVMIPEIPAWRALELAPERTAPAVRACLRALRTGGEREERRVGVVGFSFGGPQALACSREGEGCERLSGAVSWGGYADLERTLRFQFTGRHEWGGRRHRGRPDPYGRWIVGANLLTETRKFADADDVARSLHTLAATAGDRGAPSWDPCYDPTKRTLRQEVAPSRRDLFDLFAPPSERHPPDDEAEEVVRLLSAAASRRPLLDARPHLAEVRIPVRLLHARDDRLIPFTESLRIADALPAGTDARSSVTGLFTHSGQSRGSHVLRNVAETLQFGWAVRGVLGLV